MSVREFYDMMVGNTEVAIVDSKGNILWEGIETMKNPIPELIQCTDIIKWSIDIFKKRLTLWIDEENV